MCFLQKENDGDILHDSNLISQETKNFYEKLYASRETDLVNNNIPKNLVHPTLSDEERQSGR